MNKKLIISSFLAITLGFTSSCSSDDTKDKKDDNNNGGNDGGNNTTARYEHKVLIEDHTGAWCGWCPRVSYSIEQVTAHSSLGDKIVPVAIHNGDVMEINGASTLRSLFKVNSFPTALIDRENTWKSPENNNLAQAYNAINKKGSTIGIKIASDLTTNGGTVTASFKFSEGFEDLKYTIFVLENGVIKTNDPQQNYTNYYDGVDVIPNFVHNDVLVGFSGNITGNELGKATPGQEISKNNQSVTYKLSNNTLDKVDVVVFVTDKSGKVLNVQIAEANETVDYQILK